MIASFVTRLSSMPFIVRFEVLPGRGLDRSDKQRLRGHDQWIEDKENEGL